MNIFKTAKDYFDLKVEDQGSLIAVAKTVWDKCPMWVKSLVAATKLTLLTVAFVAIAVAILGIPTVVLSVIVGMWWVVHKLMQKGVSKTLSQLWAILVIDESVVTKLPVVETKAETPTKSKTPKKAATG